MDLKFLDGKTLLITGGTGSFGKAFTRFILANSSLKKLIILSRDEMKQWKMQAEFKDQLPRIRFFIGDVRDANRLRRAFVGVDFIVHAAATKIVPLSEYNPFECCKTNIDGARNVIDASLDCGVKKVVALSTDKASSPINLYGATKLVSDKLFVAGNAYSSASNCSFSVVRYGNVMGSRGSVIPFFIERSQKAELPITDPRMTRFMISMDQAIELVILSFKDSVGGEIYVRKIPSIHLLDIAKAVSKTSTTKIVGIRPGEKLHEEMIAREDSYYTYEYDGYYKILPSVNDWYQDEKRIKDGKKVETGFSYTSDQNDEWLSENELADWIEENKHTFEVL